LLLENRTGLRFGELTGLHSEPSSKGNFRKDALLLCALDFGEVYTEWLLSKIEAHLTSPSNNPDELNTLIEQTNDLAKSLNEL